MIDAVMNGESDPQDVDEDEVHDDEAWLPETMEKMRQLAIEATLRKPSLKMTETWITFSSDASKASLSHLR